MKKTLVALAALAAASAFAQSSVTLSGRAVIDMSTYEATGSTAGAANDYKRRSRVADAGSRIAFDAKEDLGGGLRAGLLCETGINVDNGSNTAQDGTANPNTSEWCSREGRAYFGNDSVELRLGRQNVYWTQGELNETGALYLVGAEQLTNLRNGGVGVYATRLENAAKVVLGKNFGAWQNSEFYVASMGSATGEQAAANGTPQGKAFGYKAQYSSGQFLAMVDYQNATAANSGAAAAGTVGKNKFDRTAINYGLGYRYNPTSIVSAQYWDKKRTDVTSAGATFVSPFLATAAAATQVTAGDAKGTGWGINVKHDLGSTYMLHVQYAKANNMKDGTGATVADTGATAYTLGLTKHLSKRTHLAAAYSTIRNNSAAAYNVDGGQYRGTASMAVGADPKVFSLGMVHQF